jgi:hypothetical protein
VVKYLESGSWVALTDSMATGATVAAHTLHFTQFGVVSADAAECQLLPRTECESCCDATYANGAGASDPVGNAVRYCGCTAGAPCEADCASNVCMAMAPSAACQTCLQTQGSASPPPACMTEAQGACTASPACTEYVSCNVNC